MENERQQAQPRGAENRSGRKTKAPAVAKAKAKAEGKAANVDAIGEEAGPEIPGIKMIATS